MYRSSARVDATMVSRSFLFLFPLIFLSLASATTISGVLRDSHGPVSGAHVVLSSTKGKFSASTSSDGRFSLSATPASDYTLSVSSDGVTFKFSQPIHVNDSASLTWELELSREQGIATVR